MPKISVVMPVYNSENYLEESIESILNQTYKNFEFIIINDGSEDNSLEIINKYARKDARIIVISRSNKGLTCSLNDAIKIARGKYIARMDADDISLPERFEKQIRILENGNIDVLGTYIEAFGDALPNELKACEQAFNFCISSKIMEGRIFNGPWVAHPSVMFRRSFIEQINGYDERFTCVEDYELWLRALDRGYMISNVAEKLFKYRMHKNSKSFVEASEKKCIIELIKCKLNYISCNRDIYRYLIWGASNGGDITYKIIKENFPSMNLIGCIDKFKEGHFNGVNIIKPQDIKDMKFEYIFICTSPGRVEAEKYLKSIGYKQSKDYIYIL